MSNYTGISYGRVSDPNQATGKSVDNQLEACGDYAKKKGINIVGEYRDDGKSGTSLHTRNGAMDALAVIAEGGVDFLMVTETDRIARNAEENYIIRKHLKKHTCKLVAVNQSYTEGESEETDLIIGIMSNIDEFFSKINGKKTKRGMLKKAERGEWPGWAPLGYKNVDIGNELKHHYVVQKNEAVAPLVIEALELFSTGTYTAELLGRIMYEKGLRSRHNKRMAKSSFIEMMKNPFYYGKMDYDNPYDPVMEKEKYEASLYDGKHPPLISKATFERNQEILMAHSKNADRSRKHDERFYLRTFLRCGICGGRITAEIHKNQDSMAYFHCSLTKQKHSNKGHCMPQSELESLMAKEFKKIQLSGPLMEKILAKAKEILSETHQSVDAKKRSLLNQIMKMERRRDNLETDRADHVIDADTFKRQHTMALQEIQQLKEQLKELDDDREANINVFSRLMLLTDDLYKTYQQAETPLRRQLVSLFFDKIMLKDRKISEVQYTKAVRVLTENHSIIISKRWLPASVGIKTVLMDVAYCDTLQVMIENALRQFRMPALSVSF